VGRLFRHLHPRSPAAGRLDRDHFSWRWIFLINPLLALPAIWIVRRHVPESRDPEGKGPLDWGGALVALLGLAGVCFGFIAAPDFGWTDVKVAAPLAMGMLLLAAFIWMEAHRRSPMLPLDLFRSRTFSAGQPASRYFFTPALGGAFFFCRSR